MQGHVRTILETVPQEAGKTYQNDLKIFPRCIDESTKGNKEEIDLPLTLMHLIYMQKGRV